MKIKIDVNLTSNGGFFEFSDDVYIDNDFRQTSQFYPTDIPDKQIFDQNLCYNGTFYSFFADGLNYPSVVWNRWDTYCDVEGDNKCCPVGETVDLRFNDLDKIKVFDGIYLDGYIDHCTSQVYYPGYPDKVSDYHYCYTYAEANEFINSFVDSWCQQYNCCDINYDSKIDYLDNPDEDYYHYLAQVRVNHLWYKVISSQTYNHTAITNTNNKCLGFYNYDDYRKIKVYPVLDSRINLSDSDYYLILNFYDYDDLGFTSGFCSDDFGAMHVKASFRQILSLLRIRNNQLYIVQANHSDDNNWLDYAFLVNNINHLDNNISNIDIIDYYYKGLIREHREHELNCFGKCFNFELVEVSSIMACTDECMLALIDSINNFRAVLSDSVGECNVTLADIAEAIRNYAFVIQFPKSYDINVKEMPCLDICNMPILSGSFTNAITGAVAVAMPADYTALIGSIITALSNLLKPGDTIQVQPAQSVVTVVNQVPVPSVSVTNQVETPEVIVNTPDTISISEFPCIEFCDTPNINVSGSVGISSIPCIDFCDDLDVNIKQIPNLLFGSNSKLKVDVDSLPEGIFDNFFFDLISSLNDIFTSCNGVTIGRMFSEAFNKEYCLGSVFKKTSNNVVLTFSDLFSNTFLSNNLINGNLDKSVFRSLLGIDLATSLANAFNLLDGSGSVFSNNDILHYKTFYDDFDEVFHNCSLGFSELFSNAFNLENCLGSVFKANDNIWNDEDTIAGIYYKQLDYEYIRINNSYHSAFWDFGTYLNSRTGINLVSVFRRAFTNSFQDIIEGYSVFKCGGSYRISYSEMLKRALFSDNLANSLPEVKYSVFNIGHGDNNDLHKILNHACNVNPNSIKFCESLDLSPNTVVNIGDMPAVEISNTNNNPINVDTNSIPDNIFVNSDGKTTRYTSEVFR